jgi:7-cyano-7-deazaguanine synthase in queuosine biosynthesis
MPKFDTLILNSGGLRSLIATAMVIREIDPEVTAMVHFQQRLANTKNRLQAMEQQAQHYGITQVMRSEMANLIPRPGQSVREDDAPEPPTFYRPQILLAAIAQAIELKVRRLVVPYQCNAVHEQVARLTEQMTLVQHIAELEYDQEFPLIDMPILDLTDRELIELGGQMRVPWKMSWSCRHAGEESCGGCPACIRRNRAFKEAGIADGEK